MRNWIPVVLVLAFTGSLLSRPGDAGRPHYGLQVRKGLLVRDGLPYRGIGVNYFDLFARHLQDRHDTSYEAGLQAPKKLALFRRCFRA